MEGEQIMASELLLINPRKKARVTRVRKNPRRKMSAAQAKYFGPRRKRRPATVVARTNPRRRRRVAVRSNPRRRRRLTVRRNPIMRRTRYRRNPVDRGGGIESALMPAFIGAA